MSVNDTLMQSAALIVRRTWTPLREPMIRYGGYYDISKFLPKQRSCYIRESIEISCIVVMMASRLGKRIFTFRGLLDLLPFNVIQLSTNIGVSWAESSTGILGSGLFMSSIVSFAGAFSFGGCPAGVPPRWVRYLRPCFDEEN